MFITELKAIEPASFSLTETFSVTLNDGRVFQVAFHEKNLIKALNTDQNFYFSVGQEFCIISDVMYATMGTESVVESFCGVLRNQKMDGGQSLEVLANRAKIDRPFPAILQCKRAIDKMVGIYINGDVSTGIKRQPRSSI